VEVDNSILTDKFEEIVNDPGISIVAEFMGGVEPARDYVVSCLKNKKTVVTANKELIAKHGLELQALAKENGVGLYYEASVAGGIPVIKILAESLQANKIGEIMGLLMVPLTIYLQRCPRREEVSVMCLQKHKDWVCGTGSYC